MLDGIYLSEATCAAIVIALIFSFFDVIAGLVCALVRRDFASAKVREGIGHKAVIILIIILSVLIEVASHYIDGLSFDVPITATVCSLVILMEIASVLETIKVTYPELSDTGIFGIFENKEGRENG